MSVKSVKKVAGTTGMATRNGSTDFWFDSDANKLKYANTSGTVVTLEDSGSDAIDDNTVFGIGTDSDGVLYLRSTILAANTGLTGVLIGTPVTPAVAANSLLQTNVTASGDWLVALNRGGNSRAFVFIDSSASTMELMVDGVSTELFSTVGVTLADDLLFRVGTTGDTAFVNSTAGISANTTLANVLVGTPVTNAVAANSMVIGNITASGDIQIAANRGGNSEDYLFIDSSAGVIYLAGYQGGIGLGLAAANPAPDGGAVHIWGGTAGSVTAVAASQLVIETSATTNAINFLGPTTTTVQGIYFGDTDNDAGSMLYSHASVESIQFTVATVATLLLNNAQVSNKAGLMADFRTSAAVSADSNQVYTAAQMLGGIIMEMVGYLDEAQRYTACREAIRVASAWIATEAAHVQASGA